jgi:hypothetical protein
MGPRQAPEIYELIVGKTDYPYLDGTVHLFVGGSAAHGAKLEGKSDFDLLGVYVPPIEEVVGVRGVDEHWVWSTAGDKVRNGANDIDMNMYSLRKWARMATSGNPSAIEFMFVDNLAPKSDIWERFVTPNIPVFLSSHAGLHFQKFCEHMLRTLKGEGQGKRGKRLDLIAEFGYDCYDDSQTEFLTDRGWKKFDGVLNSDKVAAFDPLTGEIKFETPLSKIDKHYSGLLYEVEPQLTRCVVTPNHNMAVSPASRNPKTNFSTKFDPGKADWGLVPISSLMSGVKKRVARSMYHIRRAGSRRDQRFDVQSEYLLLAGMYLSEGSIAFYKSKTGKKVKAARLTRTKEGKDEYYKYADRLIRLFQGHRHDYPRKHVECETTWVFPRKIARQIYADFGHHKEKHLPDWCFRLSYDQAWEMWNGLCLGDGTRIKTKRSVGQGVVFYTSVKNLADDIHAMMVSSGHICVVNGPYGPYGYEPKSAFGDCAMYQVYRPDDQNPYRCVNFRSGILKTGEEPDLEKGYSIKESLVENRRIVCFEMPSGTLITRSNGRPAFQGNSKAAMHLIRVLNEGIELMETGRITLPRPEKEHLIDIRKGKAGTLKDIEDIAQALFTRLESARLASALPPAVDLGKVSGIITSAQETVWNQSNEVLQIISKAFSVSAWWIASHNKANPTPLTGKWDEWQDQKWVEREMVKVAMDLHEKEKADAKKGV